MAGRDYVHDLQPFNAIFAQSLGATSGGGKSSGPIALAGAFGCLFDINYGAVTATNAQVVVAMLEGDATGSMVAAATSSLISACDAASAFGSFAFLRSNSFRTISSSACPYAIPSAACSRRMWLWSMGSSLANMPFRRSGYQTCHRYASWVTFSIGRRSSVHSRSGSWPATCSTPSS